MSLAIFAGVVVVFATVFPGGYRLNQTNMRESKVTHLATAVMDELLSMPFADLALMPETAAGGGWPSNARFVNFPATADGLDLHRIGSGDLPKKVGFYYLPERALPVGANPPTVKKGITVSVRQENVPSFVDISRPQFEPRLQIAEVEVIIYWYEQRNNEFQLRSLSTQAARPNNLVNQRGY